MGQKGQLTAIFIVLILALSVVGVANGYTKEVCCEEVEDISPHFGGGSGTPRDPYLIENVHQLQAMRDDLFAHYALASDIDASETREWNDGAGFDPVGENPNYPYYDTPFSGSLDGRGFVINELYINSTDIAVGLFGFIGEDGEVTDVGLVDVDIRGDRGVGSLAGSNRGTVENSYATGNVSGSSGIGLLLGGNGGTVLNSYTNGYVNALHNFGSYAGGLIGGNSFGIIENSYSNSDVFSNGGFVGGLVGENNGGAIVNSFATGDVSGDNRVGGLIGGTALGATINNTYATGNVSGSTYVGGLVGELRGSTIVDSYATGDVSGSSRSGGFGGKAYSHVYVSRSYSTGNVFATGSEVGGFIGRNRGTVYESFSTGSVTGLNNVGGFFGTANGEVFNSTASGDVIGEDRIGGFAGSTLGGWFEHSYSTGHVTGDTFVGGFLGFNDDGIFLLCFWDRDTSGQDRSAAGIRKSTVQLKDISTYTDEGWDVAEVRYSFLRDTDHVWNMVDSETYPFLSWIPTTYPNFTLELMVEGEGTLDPPVGVYDHIYGSMVNITASPAEGWYFSHWSGAVPDGLEDNQEISVVLDENKTLTAHFNRIEYSLEITVQGKGSTDPLPGIHHHEYESMATVTAVPDDGWKFSHWSGDVPVGLETNETVTILMDSDKTVTAHFEEVVLPLVVITSPSDGITLDDTTLLVTWDSEEGTYPVWGYEISLNGGDWIYVGNATYHTLESLDDGEYMFSVKVLDVMNNTSEDTVTFFIYTFEPEFIPDNLELILDLTEGRAPHEVNITIRGDNIGALDGSLDLVINSTVVYTLVMFAGNSTEHTYTHVFQEPGTYVISFHDLAETVEVREHRDDDIEPAVSDLSYSTLAAILVITIVIVFASLFLIKRKGARNVDIDDDETGSWEEDGEYEVDDDGGLDPLEPVK